MKVDPELVARMAAGDRAAFGVFADWLQTQGHPLGELLALLQAGKKSQAAAVLKRHRREIVGPLAVKTDDSAPSLFRDGLLRRATIDSAAKLDALIALPAAVLLEEIRLGMRPDARALAAVSSAFPHLDKLFCWLTDFTALDAPHLVRLSVYVDGPLDRQLDPVLAATRLGGVRELELAGAEGKSSPLSDEWLDRFFASPLLRQLRKLAVHRGNLMGNKRGQRFAAEADRRLRHLEAVDFTNSVVGRMAGSFEGRLEKWW